MTTSNRTTQRLTPHQGSVCPYCQRRFESPDDLTLHIVTRHTQIGIRRDPAKAGK